MADQPWKAFAQHGLFATKCVTKLTVCSTGFRAARRNLNGSLPMSLSRPLRCLMQGNSGMTTMRERLRQHACEMWRLPKLIYIGGFLARYQYNCAHR